MAESIVPERVSPALVRAACAVPSPALVYVAEEIADTVRQLRDDLAVVPDARICFAVKANRFAPLVDHLAALGLGADVASLGELRVARDAGMRPIYATAPALSRAEMSAMVASGAYLDFDSVCQLRQWLAAGGAGTAIGLRVRTPVSPSDRDGTGLRWSRFGVDPTDPELHEVVAEGGFRVTRLHAHTGELSTSGRVSSLVGALLSCVRIFPDTKLINIGGGLTRLYADRSQAWQAWTAAGQALLRHREKHGMAPALVVEPGTLLVAMAGYLVVSVRSTHRDPDGRRIATVDASGWSLMTWAAPRVVGGRIDHDGPPVRYDIAGASCYENDYLIRDVELPPLTIGDRLIFTSAGAYVSSMARGMHGFPVPTEWLLCDGEVVGGAGERIRVPGGG